MDRSNEKARQLLTEAKKSNNKIKRLRQKIAAAEKDYDYEKAESFAIKLLNLVADETPIKAKIRLYRKKKAQQKQSMLEVDKEIQEIQTMIDDYKKKYPDTPSPSFSVYEAPYNYLFKNTINDENDIHSPSKLVLRSQKFKPKPDNDKGPLSQFTMLLFFEVLIFIAIALFWGLFWAAPRNCLEQPVSI